MHFQQGQPSGVIVVDKPAGPTSHKVVLKVRRLLKTKVGHSGTLDPAATGVLPLLIGPATRLARLFQQSDKEYLATICFGSSTTTYDAEGAIVQKRPLREIEPQEALQILGRFTGSIQQQTPLYSAARVGGRRLYELARGNQDVERPSRNVTLYSIELLEFGPETWTLRVKCSSGTYIRSLAHDIGETVGSGAHLQSLRRTRAGNFGLSQAVVLEEVHSRWQQCLIPLDDLLPELPRIDLNDSQAERVSHGNAIPLRGVELEGECRLFGNAGLVAIGQIKGELIQPKIVLQAQ